MATVEINRVRVTTDSGAVIVLTKISDDKDVWLVDAGEGANYPVDGYDAALLEAETLATQVEPLAAAKDALAAATASINVYADTKRADLEAVETTEAVIP